MIVVKQSLFPVANRWHHQYYYIQTNISVQWNNNLIYDIEQHAKRSLSLSDQFLQITRAEQSAEKEFYEFDLNNTIENSIDTQSHFAMSKTITITFDNDDPIWLMGNAELMERMITNLLSNAIKYSGPNTNITLSSKLTAGFAKLTIADEGFGIEEHELPFIFNRFRRQRSTEIKGEKGAGLGLNFVKVVVEKHKGTIEIESTIKTVERHQGLEQVIIYFLPFH